ncbi:hypothetical protein BXZ70DRAFT_348396 [Cristinia sonorae]|uniref:Transmembrane protein n=1 Tax=Cristinia sonorae TaxID=1940300 RepID=A0A8K0XMW9_9AGAR|nr:hypothetical protein BXZ70DRAFT_348396 [Cristinia sonorae]
MPSIYPKSMRSWSMSPPYSNSPAVPSAYFAICFSRVTLQGLLPFLFLPHLFYPCQGLIRDLLTTRFLKTYSLRPHPVPSSHPTQVPSSSDEYQPLLTTASTSHRIALRSSSTHSFQSSHRPLFFGFVSVSLVSCEVFLCFWLLVCWSSSFRLFLSPHCQILLFGHEEFVRRFVAAVLLSSLVVSIPILLFTIFCASSLFCLGCRFTGCVSCFSCLFVFTLSRPPMRHHVHPPPSRPLKTSKRRSTIHFSFPPLPRCRHELRNRSVLMTMTMSERPPDFD